MLGIRTFYDGFKDEIIFIMHLFIYRMHFTIHYWYVRLLSTFEKDMDFGGIKRKNLN